jgi:hypothetical protein
MDEFLQSLLSYPTVFFSGLMILVVLFWLVAMIGAIDIEVLDVDIDIDADADADFDGGGGLMDTFGFAGMPISVAISTVIFVGWVVCLVLNAWATPSIMEFLPKGASRAVVFFVSGVLAIGISSFAQRPVRKAVQNHKAVSKHARAGRPCRVTSMTVTAEQGQGEIEDGGAGIVAQVRCPHFNTLKLHSRCIVVGYDAEQDAFTVEPADEPLT